MPIENGPTQHVIQGAPAVLVSAGGVPVPPQDAVRRLKAVDERLSLEWSAGAWGTQGFVLFRAWGPDDKRWARVRSGELDPAGARDMVFKFPRDCPASSISAYVENSYGDRAVSDPVAEAERIMREAQANYARLTEQAVDKTVEMGVQRIEDDSDHLRLVQAGAECAHPMVPGGLERAEPKRLLEVVK